MKRFSLAAMLLLACQSAFAADVVNVYSFRQPFLIDPILEQFTKQTGIKTKVVFAKKGLIERLKREGKFSPADVVLTSDFNKLLLLTDGGLTQSFQSKQVDAKRT